MRALLDVSGRQPQRTWIEAVEGVRLGLSAHVRDSKRDELRFQDGRLEWNLWEVVKKEAGEDWVERIAMLLRCYWVISTVSLGYDEPLRLHCEEMRAAGLQKSPRIFCRLFARRFASGAREAIDAFGKELVARIESIAAWMEAQESFSQWLAFKEDRVFWQGNPRERLRAFQARILASWTTYLGIYEYEHKGRRIRGMRLWEGLGMGTNEEGVPWSGREWANILKRAARIAEGVREGCTQLDQWVWWCYPVFSRYGWNSREVRDVARARFGDKARKEVEDFRRYWMSRGLRFDWGKKSSREKGELGDFVAAVRVPGLEVVRGVVTWRAA